MTLPRPAGLATSATRIATSDMKALSHTRRLTPLVFVLVVLGLLTSGTGLYFMVLRPALLPEDMRFMGLAGGTVPDAMLPWLSVVFRTWGGFMVGFGLSLLGLAGYFSARRDVWLRLGAGLGILFAFGSFLASNIQLHSDFLWFIGLLFVGAIAAAVLLLVGRRKAGATGV